MKLKVYVKLLLLMIPNILFAQNYYEQALESYYNNDDLKAIELFTLAIENDDHTALSYLYRGRSKLSVAGNSFIDRDDFMDDYKEAIKLDSTNYKSYEFIGTAYLLKIELDDAKSNFEKSIELNSEAAVSLQGLSLVYLYEGNLNEALKFINKAISIDSSSSADFYTNRGYIKMLMGDFEEAIFDCEKSISIDPTIQAYSNAAICCYKIEDYEKSIELSTEALKMNDRLADILINRAICYDKIGKSDLACSEYKKIISMGIVLENDYFKYKCK
ncbi:tetratricopeptide repeat protein [Flavobacterium rakeshii]|uniref:tetratricopeptide repeat protein n=1 Tax=Flavobacterium rakeshii TaxID=1038845 RepID=UPI002E7B4807|nr:tetratricopeptide repeat protein [Flavobacterium rakeshii]MEE1897966.1 tetratricopeptide repeat protein [Flavobacterium rakeshii]